MAWRVWLVIGSGPRIWPMIGVNGVNEYLTVIWATQPRVEVPVHGPVSVAFLNSMQTPLAPLGGHDVEVGSMPRAVAWAIALALISAGVWLTIAVRPPIRAAFEIAL